MKVVFPVWVFLAVAAAIAASAFGIAQVFPGAGMPFVAATTCVWVTYVVRRARRVRLNG